MIKTVDKNGVERTISLTNWNLLPINNNGTKGGNELRQVIDTLEVDSVEIQIKDFIAKKQCKNNPEKECDNTCDETVIVFNEDYTVDFEKASVEIQQEPTLAIEKPKKKK